MRDIIFGVLISMALTSCFGNESAPNSNDAASVSVTTDDMAECNSINISSLDFTGQVTTFFDTATDEISPTYLLLNMTSYPAALLTSTTVQIKIVPWYEMGTGTKMYRTVPLYFYFLDKITGQTAPSTPVNILNLSAIQTAMNQFDFAANGLTIKDFFNRELIVLVGVNSEFEAAEIDYYDTSVSANAEYSGNVLLPPFYADPNMFVENYDLPDLYNLHPFASYIGQNAAGVNFDQLDQQICARITGSGGRVPASVEEDGSALTEKLKAVPYLATGKSASANPRGEPQYSFFGKIWHRIVASLWESQG